MQKCTKKLYVKLINKTPPGVDPVLQQMEMICATAWLKSEVCSLDLFVNYANSENKTGIGAVIFLCH